MSTTTATLPACTAAPVMSPTLPAAPRKGSRPFPRSSVLSATMSSSTLHNAGLTTTSPTCGSVDGFETPQRHAFTALNPSYLRLAHHRTDSLDDSSSAASVELLQPFELSARCCAVLEIATPPPPSLSTSPTRASVAAPALCTPPRQLHSMRSADNFFSEAAASGAELLPRHRTSGAVKLISPLAPLSPISTVAVPPVKRTTSSMPAAASAPRCFFGEGAETSVAALDASVPVSPTSSTCTSFLSSSAASSMLRTPPLAYARGERRTVQPGALELPSRSVTSVHPPSAVADPISKHSYLRIADASAPRVRFVKRHNPTVVAAETASAAAAHTPAPPSLSRAPRRRSHCAISPLASACESRCSMPHFFDASMDEAAEATPGALRTWGAAYSAPARV